MFNGDATNRQTAVELDNNDPLAKFKEQFVIKDPEVCYLDGNSLGRMPKATKQAVNDFLDEWSTDCLLYTSPSPRDYAASRMPSSA